MSENETESATPVSDTLLVMTVTSLENSDLSPRELMIARIAALVAVDAPAASYALNALPAADSSITLDDVEDILVAVAPIVGTARVVSATANIAEGLGFVIALAEAELEEELEEEAAGPKDLTCRRRYRPDDPAGNAATPDPYIRLTRKDPPKSGQRPRDWLCRRGRRAPTLGPVTRQFRQVDVFTDTPYLGNPLAVVLGADGLTDEQMQLFARWTNLSETTFVLVPRADGADYLVRIFTPSGELPFAGHPTLGTCHAWLEAGGRPAVGGAVVQECGAGLIRLRQTEAGLAFAAPPLVRGGPVDEPVAAHVAAVLNIKRDDIVDIQWADNGPGWVGVLLASAEAVLALRPGLVDMDIGVVGPYPEGSPAALEVRAFTPQISSSEEPGHGQPERLARTVATRGTAASPHRMSPARARRWAAAAGYTSPATTTARCGSAARTVTCVSGTVEL